MSRILTTHVGSLPRPADVFRLLEDKERSGRTSPGFAERIRDTVADVVNEQLKAGIDIVCDGEVSKFSYTFYVRHRLAGVGSLELTESEWPHSAAHRDLIEHPARNVEVINHATAAIAPEKMRMHVRWRNYEGPHTHDIAFAKIADIVFPARPQGILFEGANPRHAHEWEDLQSVEIPDDKVLIPGLIDSTNNFVEHPQLVAQRICQYADIVGRDRVIAGTDCGFATFAGPNNPVAPSVVWAKLRSLSQGAELASQRLWGRP